MNRYLCLIIAVLALHSCKNDMAVEQEWKLENKVSIKGINPIGIAATGDGFYVSDGDHNRVVKMNEAGKVLSEITDLDRPMHIDYNQVDMAVSRDNKTALLQDKVLLIPEYGRDSIAIIHNDKRDYVILYEEVDAPAAVSVYGNEIAIADFYNNRILYYTGTDWMSIGSEGHHLGEFSYPTDVQITADKIYVADAYNNRGQVFDKTGKPLAIIGENDDFNAATGIYIGDTEIYLTDFENDRVLVYDLEYRLKQILTSGIHKPTDVIVTDGKLVITNYRNSELVFYKLSDKTADENLPKQDNHDHEDDHDHDHDHDDTES